MTHEQPENDPSLPPRKPPQMGALFVIAWVIGLLALIALGGCTIVLIFLGAGEVAGLNIAMPIGFLLMLGALFLFGRSLVQGRRAERAQQPPSSVYLYTLLLPVLAVFIWAGGCMLALR